MPPFLIGDSAFPLSVNLMKPFPNSQSLTHTQKNFNRQLSSARSVIENAFGRLKGRFRIVSKKMEFNIDNSCQIIQTYCTLHNICLFMNDEFDLNWLDSELSCTQPISQCIIGIQRLYCCSNKKSNSIIPNTVMSI